MIHSMRNPIGLNVWYWSHTFWIYLKYCGHNRNSNEHYRMFSEKHSICSEFCLKYLIQWRIFSFIQIIHWNSHEQICKTPILDIIRVVVYLTKSHD